MIFFNTYSQLSSFIFFTMDRLNPNLKQLFTKLMNFNVSNDNEFLIISKNTVLIISDGTPNESNCYKKEKISEPDEFEWIHTTCSTNEGLSVFNLKFDEGRNIDVSDEIDSENEDELAGKNIF